MATDQFFNKPDDCGCCEGVTARTPLEIYNPPGLNSIKYRVGTHASFKQSMLASLSSPYYPTMIGLKTRNDDDFSIALLDAWATVADVLTFYQEYLANESYLRTASERESVLNLARLIGYELRPGVAASAYLAFSLEDAPGSPGAAKINPGTQVQSIPGPGEMPQTFETLEKIDARAEWNEIKPRLTKRHPIAADGNPFYFEGISTGLRPGDGLLITPDSGDQVFRQVEKVILQADKSRTEVWLQDAPVPPASNPKSDFLMRKATSPSSQIQTSVQPPMASASRVELSGLRMTTAIAMPNLVAEGVQNAADFSAMARTRNIAVKSIFKDSYATQPAPPSVIAFRVKAAIFGHNAPRLDSLPSSMALGTLGVKRDPGDPSKLDVGDAIPGPYFNRNEESWVDTTLDHYNIQHIQPNDPPQDQINLYLDNVYPGIVNSSSNKTSWVVIKDDGHWQRLSIRDVRELTKSDFTLTSKVTALKVEDLGNVWASFTIRGTSVFAQSEELALSRLPIDDPISKDIIELDELVDGLFSGQIIIVCGELDMDGKRGNIDCEMATIANAEHCFDQRFTRITLRSGLKNTYVRSTVTISANVALATHGETKREVLGSGDASTPFQKFSLRQPPLTYITSETPTGAESTLKVYVNDIQWHEVPSLYGHSPHDRVFIARNDDSSNTEIEFGDGRIGARLPTGQDNVKAVYRKGIGVSGSVGADSLNLLMNPPLGVKGVTNPMAAEGGDDPEDIDRARENAPVGMLTMSRVVSLQDYEDFARSFAGIAKALATWTWNSQARGIFITVAGPKGADVPMDSPLFKNLISAMQRSGDPYVHIDLRSYLKAFFRISANILVDPDRKADLVISDVKKTLLSKYSFDARQLGQPVTLSEVIGMIQAVPGVIAVDIDRLYRVDDKSGNMLSQFLIAAAPQSGTDASLLTAAELLMLDPNHPFDAMGLMS